MMPTLLKSCAGVSWFCYPCLDLVRGAMTGAG